MSIEQIGFDKMIEIVYVGKEATIADFHSGEIQPLTRDLLTGFTNRDNQKTAAIQLFPNKPEPSDLTLSLRQLGLSKTHFSLWAGHAKEHFVCRCHQSERQVQMDWNLVIREFLPTLICIRF